MSTPDPTAAQPPMAPLPQPAPGIGDPSALAQDRSALTGSVIPSLEQEKAADLGEAQDERTLREKLEERQRAQLEPLEAELSKGFQASGLATVPPEHNIGSMMKTAPLWMTMAALAGSKGRLIGTAGISAMNGMMSGLVKGDVQQYDEHRQQYEEKMREWHEYATHIKTLVAELQKSYGSDVANTFKAEQAAMRAAGNADVSLRKAHEQVQTIDKITAQLKERTEDNIRRRAIEAGRLSEKSKADAERLRQSADKLALQVDRQSGEALDHTITDINRTMEQIRKANEGKPMPEEDMRRLGTLKDALQRATDKRLSEAQPPKGPNKAPTPDEIKAYKAQADDAFSKGAPEAEIKRRLAAVGVTDWTPSGGPVARGVIQRQ